jgi:hypothetical protein
LNLSKRLDDSVNKLTVPDVLNEKPEGLETLWRLAPVGAEGQKKEKS